MLSLSNLNTIIYLTFLISIQIYFYYLNKIDCSCYNKDKWDVRYIKKISIILLILFIGAIGYNLFVTKINIGKIIGIIVLPFYIVIKFLLSIINTLLKSILTIAIISYILRTKKCDCSNKWYGKTMKILSIGFILSFILSSITSISTFFILIIAITISFIFGMLFSKKYQLILIYLIN